MTTYLCFDDKAQADMALEAAGAMTDGEITHPNIYWAGQFGTIWNDEGANITGIHINVEGECPQSLLVYAIEAPTTPFTVRV